MALQQLFTSRKPYDADAFVGQFGKLFYDDATGQMRLGDGVTPGGNPIPFTIASSSTVGGIRSGPGVEISNDGLLTIDAAGLPISFGDFYATTPPGGAATLSSVNTDQNIDIVSNGSGVINIVGNLHVHRTSDYDANNPDADGAIFRVDQEGKVRMLVPTADAVEGAITIVGGLDGAFQAPVNTGVMLHITGQRGTPGVPSRIYNDAQNAFAAYVARRYNGTAASSTAVLADEEIMRISGTAHNGTLIPGTGNQRIVYKALGNQTLTNQGGYMEFWTTPQNTTTIAKVATVSSTGITLETGKVFTGNVTGTSTYAVTAGTVTTAAQPAITSVGTLTNLTVANTVTSNFLSGKIIRAVRDAGTIGAGGTLTIDFTADSIVRCVWSDGMTMAYQNFVPGRTVNVIAKKATGTGNDSINLDGVTAGQTSSGNTTIAAAADTTVFLECISTNGTIGGLYIKL